MNTHDFKLIKIMEFGRYRCIGEHSRFSIEIEFKTKKDKIILDFLYNTKIEFLRRTTASYMDDVVVISDVAEKHLLQQIIEPYANFLSTCSEKDVGMIFPWKNAKTITTIIKLLK